RRADPRPRPVHRRNTHEAHPRGRRPPAAHARGAGVGAETAHLLLDRRDALAGPLGRLQFSVSFSLSPQAGRGEKSYRPSTPTTSTCCDQRNWSTGVTPASL